MDKLKNAEMLEGLIEDLEVARTNYDESTSTCDMRKTKEKLRAAENAIREYFKVGADIISDQEQKFLECQDAWKEQNKFIGDLTKEIRRLRGIIEKISGALDEYEEGNPEP